MKRLFTLILTLCIVLGTVTAAFASIEQSRATCELDFDGGHAQCMASIRDDGAYLDLTMKLYRNGRVVRTWNATGNDIVRIADSYPAVSGSTYQLTFTCYVNGFQVSIPSITKVCP